MLMATITLEVPEKLARRLENVGDGLPSLLSYALDMAGIPGTEIEPKKSYLWDEVLDFLGSRPEAQEILAYRISDEAQERLELLLDLNREGSLTPEEREELDEFLRIDHFFSMWKAHVRAMPL